MISKVSRMLGHLVDDEERKTIDLPACLGEPQNDPQNMKKAYASGKGGPAQLSLRDIKHLINESQAVLREEFKQALEAFENTSLQKEKILTDSTNQRISDIQSDISKQLHQFRQEIQADLEIRINHVVKEDELNQKLLTVDQKYNKLAEQVEEIKGNFQIELQHLNDQIMEINTKTDTIKQQTQDQISNQTNQLLEFQELLKSKDDNLNIVEKVAVGDPQSLNQINDQEAAIAQLQIQFTQAIAHQRWQ
eukprot:403338388